MNNGIDVEPSLGPITRKGSKTQSVGALVCGEAAATLPHPPNRAHLERTAGKRGWRGSGNRQWKAQALFCKARHLLPLSPLPQANTSRSLETART